MKTVATMPTAIFYVALAAVSCSFICVSFVRLPKEGEVVGDEEEYPAGDNSSVLGRDDTLVDTAIPIIVVEEDRNRKSSP